MHFIQRSIFTLSTLHQKIRKSKISSRMPPPRPETTLYSYCRSGEPVLTKFWFDGTRDCRDGSDELPEDVKDEMMDKEKKDEMMDKERKDVVLMSESKVERLIDDRFNCLVLELEKKPSKHCRNPLRWDGSFHFLKDLLQKHFWTTACNFCFDTKCILSLITKMFVNHRCFSSFFKCLALCNTYVYIWVHEF